VVNVYSAVDKLASYFDVSFPRSKMERGEAPLVTDLLIS
jgi:hypothetical protein|tara:strand:- start:203 stop:319 length:117 start_codon:yes stop_codon:yes gene_type:complete